MSGSSTCKQTADVETVARVRLHAYGDVISKVLAVNALFLMFTLQLLNYCKTHQPKQIRLNASTAPVVGTHCCTKVNILEEPASHS